MAIAAHNAIGLTGAVMTGVAGGPLDCFSQRLLMLMQRRRELSAVLATLPTGTEDCVSAVAAVENGVIEDDLSGTALVTSLLRWGMRSRRTRSRRTTSVAAADVEV